ncbi:MAG: hypothetical protein EOP45_22355 [Sphingobacteriaceae bacterium]|nr:MAG: hypothetical protein EOP45_22355 [Sphingobacteriaceae bacterium]
MTFWIELVLVAFRICDKVSYSKDLTDLKELAFQPKYLGPGFSKGTHMSSSVRSFLKLPVGRLRFSKYDRIKPDRLVHIYTEGKTDAQIIEHAFTVLTDKVPYWSIQPVGMDENSGGANELTNALMNGHNFLREEETIIGIYDNDAKGCQEFGGLKSSRFELYQGSSRVKKHKVSSIFAIKLPVPPDKQNFIQDDQVYNVFSIEHYFSEDFLREKGVVEDSPIVGTFKIKESKKTEFAKAVVQISEKSAFLEFIHLFRVIDELANRSDIEYDVD